MVVGKHAIIDINDCKVNIDDLELIKKILLDSAKEASLNVVDIVFHKFEPIGISGVVVLAESHKFHHYHYPQAYFQVIYFAKILKNSGMFACC